MKASLVLLTVSIFASALVAAQNVRLCQKMTWWGWTRRYCHEINDPPMDQCINLDKHWNDATSKYTVENGCCAFYRYCYATLWTLWDFVGFCGALSYLVVLCRTASDFVESNSKDWIG
ncbi:hypothetical protein FPQ18DRAFT_342294 [Pyronema domesticum]|nr:hypothetical protein FPQ18DRAFT_342294 [Pyronema domesticum]